MTKRNSADWKITPIDDFVSMYFPNTHYKALSLRGLHLITTREAIPNAFIVSSLLSTAASWHSWGQKYLHPCNIYISTSILYHVPNELGHMSPIRFSSVCYWDSNGNTHGHAKDEGRKMGWCGFPCRWVTESTRILFGAVHRPLTATVHSQCPTLVHARDF